VNQSSSPEIVPEILPEIMPEIVPEIVVVGSCNVDLITYTDRFPVVGETIEGRDFKQGFGGKGANQAVAAAKLGARVGMVARLGDDGFGRQTLENFGQQHMDSSFVKLIPGVPSGVAPIFVDAQGRNFIVIVSGANNHLMPADLEECQTMIAGAKALVCQLEVKQETVLRAFEMARAAGVMTVLNPAPAASLLPGLLELADLILPNETELELLTGKPVGTLPEVKAAAQVLLERGAKAVIVTLGDRGALHVTSAAAVHHQPRPVKAFDSTGAGDAFIGALVSRLVRGLAVADAIEFANAAAAISVTRAGTQTSFATADELAGAPAATGAAVSV
jgi:ribokinase